MEQYKPKQTRRFDEMTLIELGIKAETHRTGQTRYRHRSVQGAMGVFISESDIEKLVSAHHSDNYLQDLQRRREEVAWRFSDGSESGGTAAMQEHYPHLFPSP